MHASFTGPQAAWQQAISSASRSRRAWHEQRQPSNLCRPPSLPRSLTPSRSARTQHLSRMVLLSAASCGASLMMRVYRRSACIPVVAIAPLCLPIRPTNALHLHTCPINPHFLGLLHDFHFPSSSWTLLPRLNSDKWAPISDQRRGSAERERCTVEYGSLREMETSDYWSGALTCKKQRLMIR